MCKASLQGLVLTVQAATYHTYLSLRSVMSVCREKIFYTIFKIQFGHIFVYSAFFNLN